MIRRLGRRAAAVVVVTAGLVLAGETAHAINSPRHLVCEAQRERPRAPRTETPAPPPPRRPVAKIGAVAPFDVDRLISIDVPSRDAFPFGPRGTPPIETIAEAAPPIVESRNDFRCLGFVRGSAGVLRVLAAPPGARFARHPYASSWVRDNMEVTRLAGIRAAIPFLRRELARDVPSAIDDHEALERLFAKRSAARALAGLGDVSSGPRIQKILEAREAQPYPGAWEEMLEAYAELDPRGAEGYALDALTRTAKKSTRAESDVNVARRAIALVRTPSPTAVATVAAAMRTLGLDEASPTGHDACLFLAARVRAGDAPLRDAVRGELARSIDTQRAANCYSELVAVAFPGESAAELDTLFLRERYRELVRLVSSVRAAEKRGATFPDAPTIKRRVAGFLAQRRSQPDIAAGPGDTRFSEVRLALHLALGAGLGDAGDASALEAMIVDPKNDRIAPWIAAEAALKLDLGFAADASAKRIALARTIGGHELGMSVDEHRGTYPVTEHVRVVDLLASRGDPRFVLGLLDRQAHARYATFEHLSRSRPIEACKIVGDAARGAGDDEVAQAFWALTVLGDACRGIMRALSLDTSAPEHVRGMAIEHLAMIRENGMRLERRRDDVERFRERARIIDASPE